MKKRLMTAQLRYSSVVRIFLLLLCLSGGGNLWAETTYELRLGANNNASALESKNGGTYTTPSFFTISHTSNTANYNSKFAGYYEGVQYTHGLKIQSDTKISFTLAATSTVTIIQAKNSNSTENTFGIKFGITGSTTAYAYTDATTPSNVTGTTEDVRIYTFSNQAAGSYTIERNNGETGLFYIKVVQQGDLTAPTSSFSNGNACAAVIPVGGSSTTVLNSFTTNSDGAVTWSVVNAGTTGATVSNASGTEGQVTVTGAGTCTIKAATAATSTYAADEKTYTLTVTQAGQFTVNVSDLKMLIPSGGVNANRNINRTIPRLDINFGGGDGVKFNQASQFLFRNSGTLQLVLRKGTDGEAANMTTIVLTGSFSNYDISGSHAITDYIQASSGTIVKTSDSQLTWTGFADDVTFTSQNLASVNISGFTVTHNGYPLNEAKETPSFSFSPSSQSALVTSSEEYATVYTSSPGFFDAVAFADGSTGTTIKANNPVAGGAGTSTATYTLVSGTTASGNATLTASFAGNDLFNAATTSTYTLTIAASLGELTTFEFNRNDELYSGTGGNLYVNSKAFNTGASDPFEFVYDANRTTLKTKVNIDPSLTTIGATATSTYFTVESSDATVLDVSNVSLASANNGTRLYFDGIRVLKAGTATLTYRFLGSDGYAAKNFSVTINVVSPITTYSGSYPYTWDFTGSTNWTSSKLQMGYYNSIWTVNGSAASPTSATSVAADNGIDKIQGLAFATSAASDLWLNWGQNKLVLNGSVTVPALSSDYLVTITGAANQTINVGGTALTESPSGTYTYRPTASGDVTFTSSSSIDIYSIAVTRYSTPYEKTYTYENSASEIDGKIRKLSGTLTFTGAGSIAAGTEITDVPGIKMTVGMSGSASEWVVKEINNRLSVTAPSSVSPAVSGRTSDNNWIPTEGYFIVFEPYVNGFIKLNGHFFGGNGGSVGELKAEDGTVIHSFSSTTDGDVDITSNPLLAGKKYYLYSAAYPLELHSFTFRPAFLVVDGSGNITSTEASKDSSNPVTANKSTNIAHYPHLITADAGQGKVKFAGDRDIVYLYDNNNVELLSNGSTIVKGTVLQEGTEEELFTYYYLQATVLELSSTTLADQAYTNNLTASSNKYVFTFNQAIEKVSNDDFKVYLTTNAGTETDITSNATVSGSTVSVDFSSIGLTEGYTYRIRIADNSVKATADANVINAEVIRTFSINKDLEAPISMVYPTGIANVGTSIVLETDVEIDNHQQLTIDDSHKVIGRLEKADGTSSEPMLISAQFSANRLVFKPTSTLENNTDYKLTILADEPSTGVTGGQIIMNKATIDKVDYYYKVTVDKAFYFSTGTSAGTAPTATSFTPANDPSGNVPVTDYASGRISFTFDQNVELEPYSTVYATPINGNEATATANRALNDTDAATTLHIDSDGKTVYFDYTADALKYDLYYEVTMPANTVVGTGGKPNSNEITFRFRMAKNPNATAVEADEFYPHTWDFNKMGNSTASTSTAYKLINYQNNPGSTYNFLQSATEDGYTTYKSVNQVGKSLDQGNDIYIQYRETSGGSVKKAVLPEFEGVRVSLTNNHTNRFEIRNVTSHETTNKNLDQTDKWVFRMNGNTHYMTLSNVPAGKLYMKVSSNTLIGINSPNATFVEDDNFEATTHDDNTRITNTNGTKALVLNVTEAGDVSFCVANFNCEKIAVAADTKTFKTTFVKDNKTYATDRLAYDVRYDLLNAFTSHDVKAYYVSAITDNPGVNAADIIGTQVDPANAVKADQGILAVYQGAVDANTEVPIFKTDVNTAALEVTEDGAGSTLKNMLKVIGNDETAFPTSEEGYYNYVLAAKGTKTTGVGFYRYTGSSFSPRAAYLPIPISYVNTGSGSGSTPSKGTRLLLLDADEQVATAILEVKGDGIASRNNDGYYYNLNGMRVDQPKAGIYIRNGKKVVVMK